MDFRSQKTSIPSGTCRVLLVVVALLLALQVDARIHAQSEETNLLKDGFLNGQARLYVEEDEKPRIAGWTIDKIRELEAEAEEATKLPYTIKSIVMSGTVAEGSLKSKTQIDLQLGYREGRANVDVKLRTIQLDKYPQFSGVKEQNRFRVTPEGNGYQWLLLGNPNSDHKLTVEGTSVVQDRDGSKVVLFDLPQAAVSTLNIKLPRNAVDIEATAGTVSTAQSSDAVSVTVRGSGGSFEMIWREANETPDTAAVEANSTTTFQIIDPEQPWSASTELEVKWYGNVPGETFTVSLPEGARWSAYPPPVFDRYEIRTDPDGRSLQVVNVSPAESDSVTLILEWEWQPLFKTGEEFSATIQVGGLKVANVDSHVGTLNCIYPAAFNSIYEQGSGIKLYQQGPSEGFSKQQQQFRFAQQDFDLQLTFRREQSLPTVRPIYHIAIDDAKLRMTAWFECSFDTSRQRTDFGLITGDWVIEENNAVVMRDRRPDSDDQETLEVKRREDGAYILRSNEIDPSGGSRRVRQLWKVVAERTWSPDDGNLIEFQIPKIIRGVIGPASEVDHGSGVLLVTAAESVILEWKPTASVSLIPDAFSTEYQPFVPSQRLRAPLAYRFQSGVTTPKWSGEARFLPQQISFEQRCNIEIQATQLLVRQDYDLRIANRPLERLQIATRQDADPKPQVFINGNLVSVQPSSKLGLDGLKMRMGMTTNSPAAQSDNMQWNEYEVIGLPSLIGPARLSVITQVPWNSAANGGDSPNGIPVNIPLSQVLLPPDSHGIQRQWSTSSNLELDKVRLLASRQADKSIPVELGTPAELPQDALEITLGIQSRKTSVLQRTSCQRSWLQTVMSGQQRHERFVARVNSNARELLYQLPPLAQLDRVAIDGFQLDQQSAPYDYSTNRVAIKLPAREQTPEQTQIPDYVVEIFYSLPETLGWVTSIELQPPMLIEGSQSSNFTWQLVTPTTQHLLSNPKVLTPEWTWKWGGAWWYRGSESDQTNLENLLGSSVQPRLPAAANSYVMSGPRSQSDMSVVVLARFMFWLPIGAIAILSSLAALSYRTVRSPVTVILLAAGLLCLSTIWPDLAMLLAQTSLIACILVALVLVTQVAVDSRLRRRSVFASRTSVFTDGSDHISVGQLTPTSGTKAGSNVERSGSRTEVVPQATASSVSGPQEEL